MNITDLVAAQRSYFRTGATLDLNFRQAALDRLGRELKAREGDLLAALRADLGKSETEGYLCEVGLSLSELTHVKSTSAGGPGRRGSPPPGVCSPPAAGWCGSPTG